MKGAKAPFAFNRHVFLNFLESLKIRTAWRKDFFDTLRERRPALPFCLKQVYCKPSRDAHGASARFCVQGSSPIAYALFML